MSKERAIKVLRGCKTYGTISFDSSKLLDGPYMCDDPECVSCVQFGESLRDAAKKQADKILKAQYPLTLDECFKGEPPSQEDIHKFLSSVSRVPPHMFDDNDATPL